MAPQTTTTHNYKFKLPNYKVTVTVNKTTGKHFFPFLFLLITFPLIFILTHSKTQTKLLKQD